MPLGCTVFAPAVLKKQKQLWYKELQQRQHLAENPTINSELLPGNIPHYGDDGFLSESTVMEKCNGVTLQHIWVSVCKATYYFLNAVFCLQTTSRLGCQTQKDRLLSYSESPVVKCDICRDYKIFQQYVNINTQLLYMFFIKVRLVILKLGFYFSESTGYYSFHLNMFF